MTTTMHASSDRSFTTVRPGARVRSSLGLAAISLIALSTLSACVGHNVYPAQPGDTGFTNVNSEPFPPILTAALQWTVTRYPPNAMTEFTAAAPAGPENIPFTVNLPAGMNGLIARRIVKNIGYNAQPLTPATSTLPIYHVSSVWVQGDDAKVDIVRPVLGQPGPGGKPATQGISLRIRGGLKPWHVTSHRVWSFNALAAPALNFVPDVDGPSDDVSPSSPTSPKSLKSAPEDAVLEAPEGQTSNSPASADEPQ